jgi:hypothetical protein
MRDDVVEDGAVENVEEKAEKDVEGCVVVLNERKVRR